MTDEQSDLGKNRSPAPDAAPEDSPEPDALKHADITSGTVGTVGTEAAYDQKGEAKEASDTTPQAAGSLQRFRRSSAAAALEGKQEGPGTKSPDPRGPPRGRAEGFARCRHRRSERAEVSP